MVTRYFVEVMATSKQQLINLHNFELDLFQPTAKTKDANEFSIEGLLTIEDVKRLVENGYKVLVKKKPEDKTPAVSQIASFHDWITESDSARISKDVEKAKEGKETSKHTLSTAGPTGGYLTSEGIEAALQHIAKSFPSIVELIHLPEKTHDRRTSRAIKVSKNGANPENGLLFLGGVHAREIINPDLLVKFALDLCNAFSSGTGLTFGAKSYEAIDIKQIVENLELYIFPLVNPDGRSFVQAPTGDVWWRKNRNPNPGDQYRGVDLNRNYDFLWESGIGTSTNPGTDIYRGKGASSEPETRNVLHLINNYQKISCVLDIHSFSELVLYPWGDDENQTEEPEMNFRNPAYDGQRGHSGDSIYKEYIRKEDLEWYESTSKRIRDAIVSTRGTIYQAQPSIGLYPTSATCHDYVYALTYADPNRKIMGFTIETAKMFQPDYREALNVMSEVSSGLVECCLAHIG